MTAFQIWQTIKEHFPGMTFSQCLIKMNEIQKEFVGQTECLHINIKCDTVTNVGDVTVLSPYSEVLSNIWDTNFIQTTFPAQAMYINDVTFLTQSSIVTQDAVTLRISDNKIEYYSASDGKPLTEFPTDAYYIVFHCIKNPTVMTVYTDTPEIPSQFHPAIIAGILKDMYAVGKEALLQNAGWWKTEYNRLRIEARKYGVSERDKTSHVGSVGDLLADTNTTYNDISLGQSGGVYP